MRYIKLYENKEEPKRFVVEQEDKDFYVWEIIQKVEGDSYLIRAVFQYQDGEFENRASLIEKGEGGSFVCGAQMLLTDLVYQTDKLKNAIEHIKISITANKYNL